MEDVIPHICLCVEPYNWSSQKALSFWGFFPSPLEFVWKCWQGFEKARTTIWKIVLQI